MKKAAVIFLALAFLGSACSKTCHAYATPQYSKKWNGPRKYKDMHKKYKRQTSHATKPFNQP